MTSAAVVKSMPTSRAETDIRHMETTAKMQRLQDTLKDLEARRRQLSHEAMNEASSETAERRSDTEQVESRALAIAKKTNQEHIKMLHQYNEIKDVATSLIGMIAENRQQRIIEVMRDFDVDEND